MQPPKKKKRDWSEDGTWDTAAKASPGGTEARTVSVALDGPRVAAVPDGASTTIGPSIVVRGRLISHEDLVVHGRIEASVRSSRDLRLEQSGVILADIEVRSATINGIVVGSIRATDRVELTAGARVVGDIDAPMLVVQDGAKFRGEIDMAGLEGLERSPRTSASSRPAPKPEPKAAKPRPAPAPVPMIAAATVEMSDPGDEPEPEPPPVVIPPSRPSAPASGPSVAPPAPSQPAVAPRVRRPETVGASAGPAPAPSAPSSASSDAAPSPSKRGWFSLG